ncbi:anti-sigma factor antagonist [Sphaerisporangium perillae]|uniref:anti-sigma factor antagonist n=1 Tax=Sphaerisporangium perillae TaxID=2935860 RepID=UPI00200C189C|nr:anti-sigma factor antagonist [Sphaerisporangium perillae]
MSDLHVSTDSAQFAAERHGEIGLLKLKGTLDYTVRQPLEDFLDQAFTRCGPDLVIDLLQLDLLDSRSTGLLVNCWKRSREGGGWLGLVAVQRSAARVLWITGLASRIPVFTTVEEALAAAPAHQ